MSIVSHVRLAVLQPQTAPDWMVTQWAEMLKANAERINAKRQSVVGNPKDFLARLAEVATKAWPGFVNPSFRSRAGNNAQRMINAFTAKLTGAFGKYQDKLDFLFATVDGIPAKRFREMVDAMARHFSAGLSKYTLPFTGDRVTGRGPAALAGLWLTNDPIAAEPLRGADKILEGGPYKITRTGMEAAFKAALTGRLVQAGVNILKAELALPVRTEENTLTNSIVQGYIDPALGLSGFVPGGASHVDFVVENGLLFLDIQVTQM